MISFECDYNNGAHPLVLQHLAETNREQSLTYGFDEWTLSAKEKIREACCAPDADIFFLYGGTQTNLTVINGYIPSYKSVVSADTGHINVLECAAIEHTGHRVEAIPGINGKITVNELDCYMEWFLNNGNRIHMAQPGMVYITFPTEFGTIYSAAELEDLYAACRKYELPLFIDGARMGYGVMSHESDVDLPFIASHGDVFYIGGTKVGALCGEAVVFPHGNAPRDFFSIIKQHGALSAKGRLMGVQFDALFTDGLYLRISRHAIDMAERMKQMFKDKGYELFIDSPTNQQFVVIDNEKVKELERNVIFTHWEPRGDTQMVCRFVTSWATTPEDLDRLEQLI